MGLFVYTLDQSCEWDKIVRSFSNYDTYWLSGYVKAFQIHGDGIPYLFYYCDESTRGISVSMKRDISLDLHFKGLLPPNTYFDFSSPYGYSGWLIEGNNPEHLFCAYADWCRNNGIISEFVRFHPVLDNHTFHESAYDVIPLGNTIVMDLSSPEVIWANLTSKNRNMIRKAQKNGVRVYSGCYPSIFKIFKEIYNNTMDCVKANSYYYFNDDFYTSILNDLPHNAQVFYAMYDNQIIAAAVMLCSNGKMNYHLSASIKEYAYLAPTNLILYEAALWGCENGCKTLYLGGGVGSKEDSLYKFKKTFYRKDDVKRFYIGKKIYLQDKYDELVHMRDDMETGFFPKYRA